MNYAAGGLVLVGGVLLVIGIRGSQSAIWQTMTKSPINPSVHSFSGGASGDFNYTPFPTSSDPQTRNHPVSSTNLTGYAQMAYQDAVGAGIDPNAFVAQIRQESGFNPNARSSAGAVGIAQFMPATASGLGVNPMDPVAALSAAARLMGNYVRTYGSEAKALAAYNAGPGTLQYAESAGGNNWMKYLPTETQNYINTIMGGGSSLGQV